MIECSPCKGFGYFYFDPGDDESPWLLPCHCGLDLLEGSEPPSVDRWMKSHIGAYRAHWAKYPEQIRPFLAELLPRAGDRVLKAFQLEISASVNLCGLPDFWLGYVKEHVENAREAA